MQLFIARTKARAQIAGANRRPADPRRAPMPRGDKSSYSSRQKRKAAHIEKGYERRGVSKKTAAKRAWATVNKQEGGGAKKRSAGKSAAKKGRKSATKKGARKTTRRSAARKGARKGARKTASKTARKSTRRKTARKRARR
jgi:hypothetical protein